MSTQTEMLKSLATCRKTVRRFQTESPIIEDIYTALETVCQAPSGSNTQPWRFLIVDEPAIKTKIRAAAEAGEKVFYDSISEERRKKYQAMGNSWKKPMLEQAPLLLVVAADTRAPNYLPSVWLAVGYLVLALEAAGLGSVTYTPSDAEIVRSALDIPKEFSVEAILPVGYAEDPKKKGDRQTAKELTSVNQWLF
jgi:nitroreductase